MKWFRQLDDKLFGRWSGCYMDLLGRELTEGCDSILDVGCGKESPVRLLAKRPRHLFGVDGFMPALANSRARGIHDANACLDILSIARVFKPKSFDAVVALDLIEHFEKKEGLLLLGDLESIARKKVIVYTPNGFLPQGTLEGNPYQVHRSGWEPAEMAALGYAVYGVNGIKIFRSKSGLPWWPQAVWRRITFATQPLVEHHPDRAFQMLCVKTLAR